MRFSWLFPKKRMFVGNKTKKVCITTVLRLLKSIYVPLPKLYWCKCSICCRKVLFLAFSQNKKKTFPKNYFLSFHNSHGLTLFVFFLLFSFNQVRSFGLLLLKRFFLHHLTKWMTKKKEILNPQKRKTDIICKFCFAWQAVWLPLNPEIPLFQK